jgi:ABC-2 type transport system permease protein
MAISRLRKGPHRRRPHRLANYPKLPGSLQGRHLVAALGRGYAEFSMNLALWKKAVSDAWLTLLVSSVLLILFCWLFVWLMSFFDVNKWSGLLNLLPNFIQPMIGIDMAKLASPAGQLSILFTHLVTLLVCVGWAVGRGSDSISGEIGRGTMDLILSLPVWRFSVMAVPAVVATVGAAVLALSVWLGMAIGLLCVRFPNPPSLGQFLPGAANLFAMTFCFTGITTFVSSWNRDRWRTISLAGGFFIVSLIIEFTGRIWHGGHWLRYFSFLSLFQPQKLILEPPSDGWGGLQQDARLMLIGLLSYAIAAAVFWWRDIPAPR